MTSKGNTQKDRKIYITKYKKNTAKEKETIAPENSVKTKPDNKETTINVLIATLGFTIPTIIALLTEDTKHGINYTSPIIAIILSIIGIAHALKSRSMLHFVISFSFTPALILITEFYQNIS